MNLLVLLTSFTLLVLHSCVSFSSFPQSWKKQHRGSDWHQLLHHPPVHPRTQPPLTPPTAPGLSKGSSPGSPRVLCGVLDSSIRLGASDLHASPSGRVHPHLHPPHHHYHELWAGVWRRGHGSHAHTAPPHAREGERCSKLGWKYLMFLLLPKIPQTSTELHGPKTSKWVGVSSTNTPCLSAVELYQPAVSGNKWAFLKKQNSNLW